MPTRFGKYRILAYKQPKGYHYVTLKRRPFRSTLTLARKSVLALASVWLWALCAIAHADAYTANPRTNVLCWRSYISSNILFQFLINCPYLIYPSLFYVVFLIREIQRDLNFREIHKNEYYLLSKILNFLNWYHCETCFYHVPLIYPSRDITFRTILYII